MLGERTRGNELVKEVRGKGLMIGVELLDHGKEIVRMMFERGVLANCTAGNVVRFLPPLNIPEEDLEKGLGIFIDCLSEVSGNE
jgi:acetylornithine/succinyldiaminopimelate/putrescine aminotransferase